MTIIEAIKKVLEIENRPLTSTEIYNQIIENNFYSFGAKNPKGVVNGLLRKHSKGIDFPTASPVKYFSSSICSDKKNTRYQLINGYFDNQVSSITTDNLEDELLPEEKMFNAYLDHKESIKQSLIDKILESDPAFFERLVIDLLISMGYGGNDASSGIVNGKPHDGGIDGIIKEDKLGLDKIYIQAKRYSRESTIGRPDLQRFVGAMENIQKGVFITTSSFSTSAISYSEKQQKNLVLIDGNRLSELMVTYSVGISTVKSFATYKIDLDYFSEQ